MNERDELATILHGKGAYCGTCGYEDGQCSDCTEVLGGYADAILAAGYRKPRTITTAEEVDALPMESVLKAADGNVWERLVGGWFETCSRACHIASDIALPATVLYEPEPLP